MCIKAEEYYSLGKGMMINSRFIFDEIAFTNEQSIKYPNNIRPQSISAIQSISAVSSEAAKAMPITAAMDA